jgi:hypothetical protein
VGKIQYNISWGVGNAREVGVYDLKIGGEFKNGASGFGWYLGSGHGVSKW